MTPYADQNREHEHNAWREGREAFERGESIRSNPYPWGLDGWFAWAEGWDDALAAANRPEAVKK